MITAKFGGTAVTPRNLHCLKEIIGQKHGCVVVSAIGKESADDVKVTDLLKVYYRGDEKAWQAVECKYKRLALVNGINEDVEKLLFDAKKRSLCNGADYCLSLGEELAAKLVASFLKVPYIEAEKCVVFGKNSLDVKRTFCNLQNSFGGVPMAVMGGFYGGCEGGRKVFSRGGGDVTGSICAVALHSTLYENWTDVNGVCVANPHLVQMPKTISSLSYREMYLLAKNGAQVLHPTAVRIAQRCAISIRVANYLNPCARDTLVSNCPSKEAFLAVTEKPNGKGFLTTLLHRMPLGKVFDILHRALDNNRFNGVDEGIISVLTDKNVVQVQSQQSLLRTLYDAFCTL